MRKYVVRVNIDKEAYFASIKAKDGKYTKIKDWDGTSPLYGAGKCYSLRLTPKIEMAMQYNKEDDAYHYAYNCVDDCYSPFLPMINAEVVEIEFTPKEIGVTRMYAVGRMKRIYELRDSIFMFVKSNGMESSKADIMGNDPMEDKVYTKKVIIDKDYGIGAERIEIVSVSLTSDKEDFSDAYSGHVRINTKNAHGQWCNIYLREAEDKMLEFIWKELTK
jgi:hypothetical protein